MRSKETQPEGFVKNAYGSKTSPWAFKGSKRRLWNEQSVARAIDYVLYGQGDTLPDFD